MGWGWGLGWGWGVLQTSTGPLLWHWGNNPGYLSFVMAAPRTGRAFVLLTNSENGLAMVEPIVKAFTPEGLPVLRFGRLPSHWEQWVCRTVGVCG